MRSPAYQQKEMEVYRMADNFLVAFAIGIIAYREQMVKGFLKSFSKNFLSPLRYAVPSAVA